MAHRGEEARLGEVGLLGAPPRLVRDGLGGAELGDEQILLGPVADHRQCRRIETGRQDEEEELRAERHQRQRYIEEIGAPQIDRHQGDRDRNGRGHGRCRNCRGERGRRRNDEQGRGELEDLEAAMIGRHRIRRKHQDERPDQGADELGRDEARDPLADMNFAGRAGLELPAEREHGDMDGKRRRRPGHHQRRVDPDERCAGDDRDEEGQGVGRAETVAREDQKEFVVEGRARAGRRCQAFAFGADGARNLTAMLRPLAIDRRLVAG